MNILIVDDNKNNRMILKLLLEDYMEEREGIEFFIDEAEDGYSAVEKCDSLDFDIVLMDIMMPNMDGIEATKIIRQKHKKIMIIAVSAVDDSERKKLILNNGAEDYIAKPVNADIFVSRMTNYITLAEIRKTKKVHSEIVANLFTKDVFSRHTRFMITSEDSLSEFWEYSLLSSDSKSSSLSDAVRSIFNLIEIQRKHNVNSDIFIEDSEDKKYFTLTNVGNLSTETIEFTLKKNNFTGNYKIDNSKISFEVEVTYEEIEEIVQEPVKINTEIQEIKVIEDTTEIIVSNIPYSTSVELSVLDYIDSDDLHDLEEYANKLNSIMLIVGGGDVTEEEVIEIYSYLDKLGSILATYGEVYSISKALTELSIDMSSHMQEFMDNSEALGPMCKAFSNDMSNWISQSFHTGAPSADFMNDTIVVNCQTIGGMLKMDELPADDGTGDDFDDIFDF